MSGRGRASRSKGCLTCRKRKVRCDERRPKCLRCEKSQRECMGYSKPLVFIVSEDKGPVSRSAGPASCYAVERAGGPQIHSSDTPSPQPHTNGELSLTCSPDISIGISVSLDGFQDDVVISHLLAKLYRQSSETIAQVSGDAGLLDVLVRDHRRSAAYVAMLGVGQAFFGRVHGIDHMVDASRSRYVKALRQIQDELATSEQIARGSMQWHMGLWCCSFLGMYEMICSSSSTAWIQHSRGLAALTEAAGPEAFQSPATKMMLKINRSFIAVGCIAQRKRTFLERHDWQTIPWANSPVPKSTWIRLQDMMCRMPGLLEDADSLGTGQASPSSIANLQAKVLAFMNELNQLRASWDRENPEARYCVSPREPDSPFTSVSYFSTFDMASECIHFDVVTLLLYGVAERIGLSLDRSSPQDTSCACSCSYHQVQKSQLSSNDTPDASPMRQRAQSHALDIFRSIEYMLASAEHGSMGAMVVIFPLRVAANYVEGCPAVLGWLGRQWRRLSGQKGFEISSRVMDIAKEDPDFISANPEVSTMLPGSNNAGSADLP